MESENLKVNIVDVVLFLIIAASTSIQGQYFPDLTIAFLIFYSLKYSKIEFSLYSFLAGILHDGFQAGRIWISPFLFPLIYLGTQYLKSNINMKFFPLRVSFIVVAIFFTYSTFIIIHSIPFSQAFIKFLLTMIVGIILVPLI
jgi:cell shape-determining protein MreD